MEFIKRFKSEYCDALQTSEEEKNIIENEYLIKLIFSLVSENKYLQEELKFTKLMETQNQRSILVEKELNELKSRFITAASHEFRTPLGQILTSVSLLEHYNEDINSEKRSKLIKVISNSIWRLNSILNDFLSLENFDKNEVIPVPRKVSLENSIRDFISDLVDLGVDKNRLSIKAPKGFEFFVDENLFGTILKNIVINALNYSSPDDRVFINAKITETNLYIIVKDQGVGISHDDQVNIFVPLFRGQNVLDLPGTGVGLTIAKKCIDLISGNIKFTSKLNVGSTFTICLPLE